MDKVLSYEALVHAIAGTVGGQVTMTTFFPLDLIRQNKQAYVEYRNSSVQEVAQDLISKHGGIHGLYNGLGPNLLALAASNFVYFYVNNTIKVAFRKRKGSNQISVLENILLNMVAGACNVIITNPLWVVNIRLKLQKKRKLIEAAKNVDEPEDISKARKSIHYKGIMDAFRKILNNEGWEAFWNGAIASLIMVINPTIQFVLYDTFTSILTKNNKKKLGSLQVFFLAALAKLIASCLTYPIQTVQTRLRNDKSGYYTSNIDAVQKIFSEGGLPAFYKGIQINMVQKVLMAAFHFMVYEKVGSIVFLLFRIKNSSQQKK
mmetsp:Transcript_12030/g.17903  ORF Transcript_12030/g.17903 Transcript_12030/m.17903 type:complete len:319 (+) Transcript_12030:47-1003(+)